MDITQLYDSNDIDGRSRWIRNAECHSHEVSTYVFLQGARRVHLLLQALRGRQGALPAAPHSAPPAARLPHLHVIFPLRHSVIPHPSYLITCYQFHCLTSPFCHLSQVRICLHHSSMPYSAAPVKEVVVWRMRSAEAQQLRAAVGACGRENYVRREPSIESGVKLRAAQAVWSLVAHSILHTGCPGG